ncbi:MAG: YdbH domain-containing protein [Parvularculaceae bacterium]|nr:YdbH domain-containing protein [Parvularculaceae bacterium]
MKGLGVARFFLVSLGLLVAALGTVFIFRAPILGFILKGSFDRAGLENARFTVREAGLSRVVLVGLTVPKPGGSGDDLALDSVSAEFNLGRLWRERAIDRVTLGPGKAELSILPDGTVRIASLKIGGRAPGQSGVQVGAVKVDRLAYRATSAHGLIEGEIEGGLDRRRGGGMTFTARTADFRIGGAKLKDWTEEGALSLAEDGSAVLTTRGAGDLGASGVFLRAATLDLKASGGPWKELLAGTRTALEGEARLSFRSAPSPAAENPLLRSVFAIRRGPDAETFEVDGAAMLVAKPGSLTVSFGDTGAVRIRSNGGDALLLSAGAGAPAFQRAQGKEVLAVKADVSGAALGGGASLRAERSNGGPWSFRLESAFQNQTLWTWKLGATTLAAAGAVEDGIVTADADLRTTVQEAKVGRLTILEAPVEGDLRIVMNTAKLAYDFFSDAEDCLRMARGRFRLEGQDSDTELSGARLCRGDGPLIAWRGGDAPQAEVRGLLTAKTGSYRLGATRIDGLPPAVDLEAQYRPKLQQTDVAATFSNGVVVINGVVVATDAKGRLTGRLDPQGLSGEAAIAEVVLTQNVPAPQLAPISATGSARLLDERVTFEYAAATGAGRRIGSGEGWHDVRRGVGATAYRSGPLAFAPGKLQPAEIVSALTGIVSGATGAASADAKFSWGRKPSDFRSSGFLSLEEMTFVGPGRAVNRTSAVSGDIDLESLTPLKTKGVQEIRVGAVDMDALKLEDGVIAYELPGDGTIRVASATFPWFGGRLGAYDATAALDGAAIDTSLKAENVDLALLLDYLKIDGLSGEGLIEGELPLKIVNGKARIVEGFFSAKGPGVIRYVGKAGEAAGGANKQAKLAFDILRDLHFEELTAKIDGPLDGALNFNIVFKGANRVTVDERTVTSPVVYRMSIEAPLLALIDQARLSSDITLQIERAGGSVDDSE